jgi:hypothetical protein
MNIQKLIDTAGNDGQRKAEVAKNIAKWGKTGLLEGLDQHNAGTVAQLLENQARQLITEANQNTNAAGAEAWNGIALPLVRRVFSSISAKEFLSTQAMNMPTGLVFWIEHKYATGQAGFTTGSDRTSQEDSLYGVTDARKGTEVATGGLYGPGRFGYTINDVTAATVVSNSASILATKEVDLNYDSERLAILAAKIAANEVVKFTIPVSALSNPDLEGVRAFTVVDTAGTKIATHLSGFTRVSSDRTLIHFIAVLEDGQTLANATAVTVAYHKQPTDVTRGDFEAQLPGNSALDIPTIDIQLRQESIAAKTRKLKAVWTQEFAQDISAYHSIDVEAELTSLLGDYITKEIDLELIDMLYNNAQTKAFWSARLGYEYDSTTKAFSQTAGNAAAYNQGTWYQTLGTKLQKVSNEIGRLTMSDGANFLVCSPAVATILESIPGYAASTDGTKGKFSMGPSSVGSIANRWEVYKVPYWTENTILMGYRGGSYLEAGAVYSPYVPLVTTPTILDPNNFVPRKGISTRYAKKMLRPEFYGLVAVEGLNTL